MEHPEQQLQCLARFFCASFSSCHRAIVNPAISLWNRLFENVSHLDYPEELKAALVQLQLHADIVLPGLETSSSEYAGQQPSFVNSFEDISLPKLPSTRSSSRRGTPRPTSAQSKSPDSLMLARRHLARPPQRTPAATDRRNPTPRLRHDDSQVQFAAIEPSSALGSPMESQVLTERQKEVRDRQRENAGLFSEIQSSPGMSSKEPGRQMLPVDPRTRQATTPEPDGAFDDYVSSTPTPRRGQPMLMPEHDMTDPPSSPPELRGNPLAAEIRSRSASHSLLEEWQFSSSPVSGSPNPNGHGLIPDPSGQRGYVSVVSLPEVEDEIPSSPAKGEDRTESPLAADEVIEDSMVFEAGEVAPAPERFVGKPAEKAPCTPRRSVRLSQPQAQETPPSKSDGEEFVDAATSPQPSSPRQAESTARAIEVPDAGQTHTAPAESTSFDMNDVDETSLLRLVVELDSGKANRSEYHRSSPPMSPYGKAQGSPVADCIVVGESPKKTELPAPPRLTRASSAASAMSTTAEPQNIPSSQPTTQAGRQKRKRGSSQVQEASPKRPRQDSVEGSQQVPDSQTAAAQEGDVEIHASEEALEALPEDGKTDDVYEERIPSSSAEPSGSEGPGQEHVSQDSADSETGDVMDVEGDDQDVQSQIALEFSHSQRQEDDDSPTSSEASLNLGSPEEQMLVDIQIPIIHAKEEDEPASTAESVTKVEDEAAPEPDQVQKIMDLLRGGLDELRLARLSREEFYQIEDMFMDMKRELCEAERRGRA